MHERCIREVRKEKLHCSAHKFCLHGMAAEGKIEAKVPEGMRYI